MNEYRRIRVSQAAFRTDMLRDEMVKLQQAVKRISENWNDVVAQGVQTTHINQIVTSCNSVNSILAGLTATLEADLAILEQLNK